MKGLFLKDIINLKQQAKIYLLIILIWMVIGFFNKDGNFFGGAMTIFSVLVPISAIAYDEKAKWDRYVLTMPVSKTDIVLSKYLLAIACAAAGTVLSAIVNMIISKDLVNSLITSMVFISLGMVFVSIVLPIIFKYGVEKGRMLMIAIILLPTVFAMLIPKLNIPIPSEATIEKAIYFSPALALLMVAVSVFISKFIYEHKEF